MKKVIIKNFGQFVNEQREFSNPVRDRIRTFFTHILGVGMVELSIQYGGDSENSEEMIEYFDVVDSTKWSPSDFNKIEKFIEMHQDELMDDIVGANSKHGFNVNRY